MPTIITHHNPNDGKDYVIKILTDKETQEKSCSTFLLLIKEGNSEAAEIFIETFGAPASTTFLEVVEKAKNLVNSYRN